MKTNEKKADITEIPCWHEAREFVNLIYKLTNQEEFCQDTFLCQLIRKDSLAMMAKIGDGFHRGEVNSFQCCLEDAKGLLGGTISYLYIAFDQGYLSREELNDTLAKGYTVGIRIKSFLKNM